MRKTAVLVMLMSVVLVFGGDLFVVNSNSQTLSKIDSETGNVNNDFASLGQFPGTAPNKIAFADGFAYVVISYENCVQKIDISSGNIRSYIFLEDSSTPNDIVISDGFAYVSGNVTNKVYKIDLSDNSIIGNVTVGTSPQGMCVYENNLFVANTGFNLSDYSYDPGTVSVINTDNFEVMETISVNTNPAVVAVVSNSVHVVCTGNYVDQFGKVDVINIDTFQIETMIDIGSSPASIAYANNNKIYLGNAWPAGVFVYDATTYEIESTPDAGVFIGGNSVSCNDEFLVVADAVDYIQNSVVRLYNLSDHSFANEFEVGVGVTDAKFYVSGTDAESQELQITNYELRNYPNPFNPATTFSFEISNEQNEQIMIEIFNAKGQKVDQLRISNYDLGINEVVWDADKFASGVYFYKLNVPNSPMKKMILMK